MSLVYRKANRLEDITAAYTAASAACPTDAGLLISVFSGHVRRDHHLWHYL